MITYRRAKVEEINDCFNIRINVFVNEQGWTMHEEIDELENDCIHYLVLDDNKFIGTLRVHINNNIGHIGRVCLLKEYRGQHIGSSLLTYCLNDLKNDVDSFILSSRIDAINFYKKIGFSPVGETYMFGPTLHINMKKTAK